MGVPFHVSPPFTAYRFISHSFHSPLGYSHTHSQPPHRSGTQLSMSFLSWSQCPLRSLGTKREKPEP